MRSSAWRLSSLAVRQPEPIALALPYRWTTSPPAAPKNEPVLPLVWEQTYYPTASLHATASDYARFVAALAGDRDGTALLADGTVKEMLRVPYRQAAPGRALILGWTTRGGARVVAHGGQNDGYRHEMFFTPRGTSPDGNVWGVVILTNGDYTPLGDTFEATVGGELMRVVLSGGLP
jgi:hypothetical protein